MKNLFVRGLFFDAEDAGGAGGGSDVFGMPGGGVSQKSFYENAPIIGSSNEKVNQPGQDSESKTQGEDDSNVNDQVNQPDENQESNGNDEENQPEIVDLSEAATFKIGDKTYSKDDLEKWRKDSTNREKWVGNLTNMSKTFAMVNELPPEQQDRFIAYAMPYVLGQQQLPEGFEEKPLEFDVTVKDEYDSDVKGKYSLKPGTSEYDAAKEHFYNQFKEENKGLFLELQQHRQARKQFEADRQSYESNQTAGHVKSFISDKKLDFPLDGDLMTNIKNAYADRSSPYRKTAVMLVNLAQHAQAMGFETLQEAHDDVFGRKMAEKEAAKTRTQKTKNAQNGAQQEKPGQSVNAKSKEEQWREKHFNGSNQTRYARGFDSLWDNQGNNSAN